MKNKPQAIKLNKKIIFPVIISGVLLFTFIKTSKAAETYLYDNSQTIKSAYSQATLYLSYDDGILCFINDQLVINVLNESHINKYWNKEVDVYRYLKNGSNYIACQVSNGDGNSGNGGGNFDAELVVSGTTIFSRGANASCYSSTSWKFFGNAGSNIYPSQDANGRYWYHTNYNDANWSYGTAPFGEGNGAKSCTKGILKKVPDDAWFRKGFYISNLQNPGYDINSNQSSSSSSNCPVCPVCPAASSSSSSTNNSGVYLTPENYSSYYYVTKNYAAPVIIVSNQKAGINNNQVVVNKKQKIVIIGLVKYNSNVKIYIDGKYASDATVKDGQSSGVSNFYYYPNLTTGRHTYFAVAQNKTTGAFSIPSQLITIDIK